MSDNPFQAPKKIDSMEPKYGPHASRSEYGRSYVQQIPVIASLILVQGVLFLIMGLFFLGMAIFMTQMDAFMPDQAQPMRPQVEEIQEKMSFYFQLFYGVVGSGIVAVGLLHLFAAFRVFFYRGRILAIATMIIGIAASFGTCYCIPTAIALAVYGMIIFFNPATVAAFNFRKSGMDNKQVLEQFPY